MQPIGCTAAGASDATREDGTSGFGTGLGSALRAAGGSWGPKSPSRLSKYAGVRVLRVARRAMSRYSRKNVTLHKGNVITSEAQLALIFGQRVVDKVGATITADAQHTPQGHQEKAAARQRSNWTSLPRSHEHFTEGSAWPLHVVLFKRALDASCPHWGILSSTSNP